MPVPAECEPEERGERYPPWAHPLTGSVLAVLSGLSLLLLGMLLPLVGKAGAATEHADANAATFGAALGAALLLSLSAAGSKLARRARDGSPLPRWSLGMAGFCLVLTLAFLAGWLDA